MPRPSTVAVVALVVAQACGGGAPATGAGSSTGPVPSSAGTGPTARPSTSFPPSRPTTTRAFAGQVQAPPRGVDPSKPVRRADILRPGVYTYRFTQNGQQGDDQVLEVIDQGEGEGWARQLHYFGRGTTVTAQLVVWMADRLYAEAEQRQRAAGNGAEHSPICGWDPGLLEWKLPFRVGSSWRGDSRCVDQQTDPSAPRTTRRRTIEARVTGTQSVEVGGQTVPVFVIERTTTSTSTVDQPPLTVVQQETATDLVSAERHLTVRTTGTRSETTNGVPKGLPSPITLDLVSLEPTGSPPSTTG